MRCGENDSSSSSSLPLHCTVLHCPPPYFNSLIQYPPLSPPPFLPIHHQQSSHNLTCVRTALSNFNALLSMDRNSLSIALSNLNNSLLAAREKKERKNEKKGRVKNEKSKIFQWGVGTEGEIDNVRTVC